VTHRAGRRPLRVALLGCGVVGSEVVRLLAAHADDITARVGVPLEICGIAVRRPSLVRDLPVDPALFTTDAAALVADPDTDLVIEVIGGIEPARTLLLDALERGASVVTANKALLAQDGPVLSAAAEKADRDLYYEAAVCGAIPLLRPLRESLAGDRVRRLVGIVNGTTNYILDRMDTSGAGFADALGEAQALGYAEADPTADVEGFDAAAKAAILASLAFDTEVAAVDVYREGITDITATDVAAARAMGCVLKLLAICETIIPEGETEPAVVARVHPAMVPLDHPLAAVRQAYNAVTVDCEAAGRLMFYGPGAGGRPTASAVLGDLVTAARNRLAGVRGPVEATHAKLPIASISDISTRYHVRLQVADRPGVLAAVAETFARHGVSLATVRQQGTGADAELVVVTHHGRESALAATVAELRELDSVADVAGVLRVESLQPESLRVEGES
jgi:homoserine dehydrogenase